MAETGFNLLGDVLGGGIDREGARLEGLLLGGKTQEALAKAKIRRDEAEQRLLLEESLGKLGLGEDQSAGGAGVIRAGGGNIENVTGALGDIVEQISRAQIADPAQTPEVGDINRILASFANAPVKGVEGIGAGITTDIFGPEAGGVDVAPTGAASIEAAKQLALLREAKRLHPELFRSSTTFNLGGSGGPVDPENDPLGDLLESDTIIPEGLDPGAALGLGGAVREAANVIGGLFDLPDEIGDLQLQAPETRQANAVLNQLATMSTLKGVITVPGRPTNDVREMFAGLDVHPLDVLNGDARAMEKWKAQLRLYKRELQNITKRLRAGTVKGGTARFDENVQAGQTLTSLVADFEAIIEAFNTIEQKKKDKKAGKKTTFDVAGFDTSGLEIGDSMEIEGGTITRIPD